jgi:kynurenine formamidase
LNIKKIVDLSIPITNHTPVYPGDPEPHIQSATTIENDGYNVSNLDIESHTGTHVDAPIHFNQSGFKMDEVPIGQFMGEGIVIRVTDKQDGEAITLEDVQPYAERFSTNKLALFHTGWSQYIGEEKYFRHPYISEEVITFMLEKGIRVFLVDALNIDPPDGSSFKGHQLITAANGIIGENYTNFDLVDFEKPFIITLPLRLAGGMVHQ